MKYTIHNNGWTVILDPKFKIKNATQDDINFISKLVSKQTVVILREQDLTPDDEVRLVSMFKDLERAVPTDTNADMLRRLLVPGTDCLCRVTGELDEHGDPGLFGHVSDLDWHCNQAANEWRHPLVWLYSVKGSKGSKTSWINYVRVYEDLPEEDKEYFKTIKMINGYRTAQYGGYSPDHFGKEVDVNYRFQPNLVYTNQAGVTGLFFPFLQIHQIVGMDEEQSKEFINKLRARVEQEKYIYHHIWEDGDVNISDQWLGVHKRWEFEGIANRVLHRATMRYPDQDYS